MNLVISGIGVNEVERNRSNSLTSTEGEKIRANS